MSGTQPLEQAQLVRGQLDAGDTGLLKAELKGPGPDLCGQCAVIDRVVSCGWVVHEDWIWRSASEYVAVFSAIARQLMTANTLTGSGIPLYRAAQMRELDRLAIEAAGIPGYTLMQRAASAAWAALRTRWPQARTLVVLCGAGNNGGDGYVLARLARADGRNVRVLQLGDEQRIRGDALTARSAWLEAGGSVESFDAAMLAGADLIVDALLGTGFAGRLDTHWIEVIDTINAAGVPVMAMDIPSGLHADTGHVADTAVRAQLTVTFIGHKPGLYTGAGPAQCGAIVCADLDIPGERVAAGRAGGRAAARAARWPAVHAAGAHGAQGGLRACAGDRRRSWHGRGRAPGRRGGLA